ncbi:MAG: PilZ domain-containing protein [Lachnospiraceae bacterium]|nr:PilZ domain-containing protein [Lachnospiraceae bacterium]
MRLRDCDNCLVYGTDNRPLSRARVENRNEEEIRLFFRNPKLRSVRFRTMIDFYDRSQGVIRSRCELVIQRNSLPTRIKEPWMAECEVLEIVEVFQRQKDLRVEVQLWTEFQTASGWFFSGTIRNISAGGILLATTQELKKNDHFSFRYRFGVEDCEVKAKVLRVGGLIRGEYTYGCQFQGLSLDSEAAIRKFVFAKQVEKQNQKGRE